MNLAQKLDVCRACTKREMNPEIGLVCSLTSEKPAFEAQCPDYENDPNAKTVLLNPDRDLEVDDVLPAVSEEGLERLRTEQDFNKGMIAGVCAGLLGAILWGVVTVATEYQIGYMAIAVGAGVGYCIRYFGKGIDMSFGIGGAVIAVISCLLGNFFSIVGFVANEYSLGYLET